MSLWSATSTDPPTHTTTTPNTDTNTPWGLGEAIGHCNQLLVGDSDGICQRPECRSFSSSLTEGNQSSKGGVTLNSAPLRKRNKGWKCINRRLPTGAREANKAAVLITPTLEGGGVGWGTNYGDAARLPGQRPTPDGRKARPARCTAAPARSQDVPHVPSSNWQMASDRHRFNGPCAWMCARGCVCFFFFLTSLASLSH